MADRYWVGGTGTWNSSNTANWSATSGGAGGASIPTAADSVFFDGASAAGNYTVTLTGTLTCLDLNLAKATAGTLTTSGTATFTISGNVTVTGTGVTWNGSGSWVLNATTAKTITSGGIIFPSTTFNGVGGSWQLQDNLTTIAAGLTTLSAGTLDINSKTLTTGLFNSNNTNIRTIAFGTGNITLVSNANTIWNTSTTTNLTITGTPVVNSTYAGATGTRTITPGTLTEATAITINITAGTDIVFANGSIKDLNFTGFSGTISATLKTIYGNLTIPPTATVASGLSVTTFGATSGTKTISTGNLTLAFPITFAGSNTTVWQMQTNFTAGSSTSHSVILSNGTLDFNNRSANIFILTCNGTSVRGFSNIAGNTMNITGTGTTVLNFGSTTNLTWPQGYTINFVGNGAAGTARSTSWGGFGENVNPYAPNILVSTGADNVTVDGTFRDLDFTGFSGNLLTSSGRTLYGNLVLSTGMTVVPSSATATTLAGTLAPKTVTTNGKTIATNVTVNAPNSTYQLQDDLNMFNGTTLSTLTVAAGNLDLNNKTTTSNAVTVTGGTKRSIAFGTSGVMNIAGQGAQIWTGTIATNFSYTGNARVNLTANTATGTRTIVHGTTGGFETTKAPPFYVTGNGTDTITTTATSHLSDLVFTVPGVGLTNTARFIYGNLVLSYNMPLGTGTAVTTFAGSIVQSYDTGGFTNDFPITIGNGSSNGILQLANITTLGSTRNVTLTSGTLDLNGKDLTAGIWSSNNTNTRAINPNGANVNISGSSTTVWDMANMSGFSYPTVPTVNFTYSGATGTRVSAGSFGTETNGIDFYVVGGSDAWTMNSMNARNMTFVGYTGIVGNASRIFYGNLTLSTGMTYAGATTFNGNAIVKHITTNGVSLSTVNFAVDAAGGTLQLTEPLAVNILTLTNGNIIANGYDVTASSFSSNNANPRTLDISNVTMSLSGIGTIWNMLSATNATVVSTNSNINLTNTTTGARTFSGGNLTYGNLIIGGTTGSSVLTFVGNNTFAGAITSTKTVTHTLNFTSGTTTTVGGFNVAGSSSFYVNVKSVTAGAQHNLILTGGGNVTTDYLIIKDSNASPAANTWFAGSNSIDNGNNLGWIFPSLSSTSSFFLVF